MSRFLPLCFSVWFKVILVSLWHVAVGHERERMKGETFFLRMSHWPRNWRPTALCKQKSSCFHWTARWNIGQSSCREVRRRETRDRSKKRWKEMGRQKKNKEARRIRALSKYRWRWEQVEQRQRNGGNQWGRVKTKRGLEMRLHCSWVGGKPEAIATMLVLHQ